MEDLAGRLRIEETGQGTDLVLARREPAEGHSASHDDGHTVGRNAFEDDAAQPLGVRQSLSVMRRAGQKPLGDVARPVLVLAGDLPFPRLELEGEYLPEQLGCGPVGEAREPGRIVVAGEKPPQLAFDHDRDRERRPDPHILQILDVDRRNGSEDRHRQVERLPGSIEFGDDGNFFGRDVGDDAKDVAQI